MKTVYAIGIGVALAAAAHFGGQYAYRNQPLSAIGVIGCDNPAVVYIITRDGHVQTNMTRTPDEWDVAVEPVLGLPKTNVATAYVRRGCGRPETST